MSDCSYHSYQLSLGPWPLLRERCSSSSINERWQFNVWYVVEPRLRCQRIGLSCLSLWHCSQKEVRGVVICEWKLLCRRSKGALEKRTVTAIFSSLFVVLVNLYSVSSVLKFIFIIYIYITGPWFLMIVISGECECYIKRSVHECRWKLTWQSRILFSWWKSK